MARRELLSRNCQVELEDKNQCINDYGDAIPRIVLLGSHPGTYTCTCITFIHSKSLILLVSSSSFFNVHCMPRSLSGLMALLIILPCRHKILSFGYHMGNTDE